MARILVIDDDADVGETLRLQLEEGGYGVDVAGNGRAGIAKFREKRFDLVLTDLFMPDVEGIETLRTLRGIAPDVPVVVMSGGSRTMPDPGGSYLDKARRLGAAGTLAKPFGPRQLLSVVGDCLDRTKPEGKALPGL